MVESYTRAAAKEWETWPHCRSDLQADRVLKTKDSKITMILGGVTLKHYSNLITFGVF